MRIEQIDFEQIISVVGNKKAKVFKELMDIINDKYDLEISWYDGGKKWIYECKYKKGSKTICSFLLREATLGFMIIFGKDEREKVETIRPNLSKEVLKVYDDTTIYHDGKWVMFELGDSSMNDQFLQLLTIKRKPKC
ncbi:DUF3788 domain-containing protein [Anaerorhabdus sp.]|uniref:DUF3788 domain-containing protein n=1 Tax=Anaerorhabdus sp. TaxID=1872524 RepID=UPI002FCA439D